MWIWIFVIVVTVIVLVRLGKKRDVAETLKLAMFKHDQLIKEIDEARNSENSLKYEGRKELKGTDKFLDNLRMTAEEISNLAPKFANESLIRADYRTVALFDWYKFSDYAISGLSTLALGKEEFPKFRKEIESRGQELQKRLSI